NDPGRTSGRASARPGKTSRGRLTERIASGYKSTSTKLRAKQKIEGEIYERYTSGYICKEIGGVVNWAQRADDCGRDSSDSFTPGCRNRRQPVGRLAARFQRMRPSGVCLAYAKRRRPSLGVAGWDSLHFHRRVFAHASIAGLKVTDDCAGDLPILGGDLRVCLGIHTPPVARDRLVTLRRDHHLDPRCDDLEDVAK